MPEPEVKVEDNTDTLQKHNTIETPLRKNYYVKIFGVVGLIRYAVKLEMRKILETIFEVQVKQQKPFSSLFINHKKRTKFVLLIRW